MFKNEKVEVEELSRLNDLDMPGQKIIETITKICSKYENEPYGLFWAALKCYQLGNVQKKI